MSCIRIDQNFLDWSKKYGTRFTVEQYVKNGDFLPSLSAFENTEFSILSESQLQEEINKLLPEGVFTIDNINNIVAELPKEAKAAFFNRVLYFGETAIKEETPVKEGVDSLFYSNKELEKIGSQKEYSEYISTIFPDSKVKDIVYHGTNADLSGGFSKEFSGSGSGSPIMRGDIYTTLQPETTLQYIKGVGTFENKTWTEQHFELKRLINEDNRNKLIEEDIINKIIILWQK